MKVMMRIYTARLRLIRKIRESLSLFWQALKKFNDDNGFFLSSGIAFNILINMIPFIILLLAVVGAYLYNDQEVLFHIRAYLKSVAPAIDPQVMSGIMDVIQKRQTIGIIGFVGLVWFSTWVFGSLRIALNIVFRVEKPRWIVRALGVDLLMVGVIGILFLINITLSSFITILQNYQGWILATTIPAFQWMLEYLLPFLFTYCVFWLVYMIIPNRTIHFKPALKVALFSSLFWELAKHLFAWYVLNIGTYSIFYGSLSALIIFVFWIYYSSAILVMGGELLYILEEDRNSQ